jgi:uncharacterized repeat protein (TIGR02059 family)
VGAFNVTTGGNANAVTAVAVNGSTVVLTLTTAVTNGQAITVAYTDPSTNNDTNAVQDAVGNDAATLVATTVTNSVAAPADITAPVFQSAATSTDGTKVILTYNEALSATTAAVGAFNVTTGGNANAVTAVAVNGSTVVLTLTTAVTNGQAITVAYTDPSTNNDTNAVQGRGGQRRSHTGGNDCDEQRGCTGRHHRAGIPECRHQHRWHQSHPDLQRSPCRPPRQRWVLSTSPPAATPTP